MTSLVLAPLFSDLASREETLAACVDAAWEELSAGRTVSCPVCHGEMSPEYAQHARPVSGRCARCGSQLS